MRQQDANWSTVSFVVVIMLPKVNGKKRGNKVKKATLAESSAKLSFYMIYIYVIDIRVNKPIITGIDSHYNVRTL